MKKLSKLTALLLALVLALSMPLQVLAEDTVSDAIDTLTEYLQVADTALYDAIMGFETYGDYWEIGYLLEDEDVIAYIANNDETRVKDIQDHLDNLWWDACVSYSGNPGPLMPPVETGGTTYALRSVARDITPNNGLELTKTAIDNKDGTYTITLEAYAEGNVTQKVEGVPVDIVLVLDYSSSMTSTFGSMPAINALRQAVSSFIDTIKNKYDEKTANHRISIVLFDGGILDQQGWNRVDGKNIDDMKDFVNNTNTGSGTNPASGLNRAIELFNKDYNPPEPSTRQKAVVLFTDGLPADPAATNAHNAISAANWLKSKDVTIYTVAVHSSANPGATPVTNPNTDYGSTDLLNAMLHAISSNYKTASSTNNNQGLWITYGNRTTVDEQVVDYYFSADNPDDLNSKFENIAEQVQSGAAAIQLGSSAVVIDTVSQYFQLPANASKDDIKVYTSAYNGATQTWAERVPFSDAIIDVDGRKVSVSNFDYTYNFVAETGRKEGDPTTAGDFYGRKLIIEFKVEPVDGFLGGNDVVTNDPSSGVYQPDENKELQPVETFPVPEVNVPVEHLEIVSKDQHIYLGNAADLDALLKSFSTQYWIVNSDNSMDGIYDVDTIRNHYATVVFTLTTQDKDGKDVVVKYTIPAGANDGMWTYSIDGTEVPKDQIDLYLVLTKDKTYEVSYEVQPTPVKDADGNIKLDSEGNPVTYVEATRGTLYPTIHVHTPTLTFADSVEDYQGTVFSVNGNVYYTRKNYKGITWDDHSCTVEYTDADDSSKHTIVATYYNADGKYSKTETVETTNTSTTNKPTTGEYTMLGTDPTLVLTYTPALQDWQSTAEGATTGTVEAIADVPVNVAVSLNGTDYTSLVTTVRKECACDVGCAHTVATSDKASTHDPEFVIHITNVMGSLTITKQAGNKTTFDPNETFIFTVEGTDDNNSSVSMTVTIKGAGSVTINNLLVGDYTVTEDENWAWRYKCTVNGSDTNTTTANVTGGGDASVTFTNTVDNPQWIDGNTYAENVFGEYGAENATVTRNK